MTGEALARLYAGNHAEVLRSRPGRLRRRRLRRATSGRSFRTSTAILRVPVRDVVHRVVGAVEKVQGGDPAATQAVPDVLSAGGSKYPIDLLKDAGVDMTTDEPLDLTIQKMNRVMDQMESMLEKRDARKG